jgi:hypothetical protein
MEKGLNRMGLNGMDFNFWIVPGKEPEDFAVGLCIQPL